MPPKGRLVAPDRRGSSSLGTEPAMGVDGTDPGMVSSFRGAAAAVSMSPLGPPWPAPPRKLRLRAVGDGLRVDFGDASSPELPSWALLGESLGEA